MTNKIASELTIGDVIVGLSSPLGPAHFESSFFVSAVTKLGRTGQTIDFVDELGKPGVFETHGLEIFIVDDRVKQPYLVRYAALMTESEMIVVADSPTAAKELAKATAKPEAIYIYGVEKASDSDLKRLDHASR